MRSRHGAGRHPIHRDVINPALLEEAAERAATVSPLGLGGPLITVDTSQAGAPARAAAAVAAALA
jgi:hypothetical protein